MQIKGKCPTCGQSITKKEQRIAVLKSLGINLEDCFSLSFDDGETITKDDLVSQIADKTVNQIYEDSYIENSNLHRRWIMAHTFRLIEGGKKDWTQNFKARYNYMYQFNMLLNEARVLAKLEEVGDEVFVERSLCFPFEVFWRTIYDYSQKLKEWVCQRPTHRCNGKKYVTVGGYYIFCDELEEKVFTPLYQLINKMTFAKSYKIIFEFMLEFKKFKYLQKLNTTHCIEFVDCFKKAGAYFTLQNMFRFHNCKIAGYSKEHSLKILREMLDTTLEGYKFLGLLKQVIKDNDFSFERRMKEIYCK